MSSSVPFRVTRMIFLAIALFSLSARADEAGVNLAYRQAVNNAAFPAQAMLSKDLVALKPGTPDLIWRTDGKKLLVVTWKSQGSYEKFLKPNTATPGNPDYAVWVTAAPQVQRFCADYARQHADPAALNLRLKQWLGLDPGWNYDVFVEMWVDPTDLFRPCVDPETTDSACNLHFSGPAPVVRQIPDYPAFYSALYFKSFRASNGVPWTGLGYTYDWGSPNRVGASEFILAPNSRYEIRSVVPTAQYCGLGSP